MFDAAALANDLKEHLRIAQDILVIVEKENVTLRNSDDAAAQAMLADKKAVLPELNDSLARLKKQRAEWLRQPAEERARHPEIAGLLRQNQDVIMKIIVLDRENEQALLRKGLVPPRHLPSANRQKPHYVADLYRRGGNG
jgi:hypothetical protein